MSITPEMQSHIGVYGIIQSDDGARLLLIHKGRGPYNGLYDLPGGSLEDGELLENALFREIEEETACAVLSMKQSRTVCFLYPYKHLETGQEIILRHIGVLYTVMIEDGSTPSLTGDGIDSRGAEWVEINTLNETNASPLVLEALNFVF